MKTLALGSFSLITVLMLSLVAVGCDDTSAAEARCGDAPVGITCRAADGTCSAQACTSGEWECPASSIEVALIPGACSGTKDTDCGDMPNGVTCQTSTKTCVAQECVGSTWTCPVATTQVALVADSCSGGVDPSAASVCGNMPMGVTCQTSTKTCVAQACVAGAWTCPADTTQVALVPDNCSGTNS